MKISQEKKEVISEQVLAFLYSNHPKAMFTAHIAKGTARDEEFMKKILKYLKEKKIISEIKMNPNGKTYKTRSRWALSDKTYIFYKNSQTNNYL